MTRDDWRELSDRNLGTRGNRKPWGFSDFVLWALFIPALLSGDRPAPKEPHDD